MEKFRTLPQSLQQRWSLQWRFNDASNRASSNRRGWLVAVGIRWVATRRKKRMHAIEREETHGLGLRERERKNRRQKGFRVK